MNIKVNEEEKLSREYTDTDYEEQRRLKCERIMNTPTIYTIKTGTGEILFKISDIACLMKGNVNNGLVHLKGYKYSIDINHEQYEELKQIITERNM